MKKSIPVLLPVLLASLVGVGPAAAQEQDVPAGIQPGGLRILHASPDTGPVDVWVDGTRVLESAAFGSLSSYAPVDAGRHRVQVKAAPSTATDAALLARTVSLQGRRRRWPLPGRRPRMAGR